MTKEPRRPDEATFTPESWLSHETEVIIIVIPLRSVMVRGRESALQWGT